MSTSNLAPVVPASLAFGPVVAASFACASTGPTTQIAPTTLIRGNQLLFTDKPPSAIHAPAASRQAATAGVAVGAGGSHLPFGQVPASLQRSCQKAVVGREENRDRARRTDRTAH